MTAEKIRESVIAGTWYPGHPERLTREIRAYLSRARVPDLPGRLVGLIAPHAGYMYSGPVAAHAYKVLERKPFSRVVILAPSIGRISTEQHLPSGWLPDPFGRGAAGPRAGGRAFGEKRPLFLRAQAHAQEHSLEIQLPFLQVS